MAKKKPVKEKKKKEPPVDGLGPKDLKKIRAALRLIWSRSHAPKLVKKRSTGADGFPVCEKCKKKVPKIYVDHIHPIGEIDDGVIKRIWLPSILLQALCKKCHDAKTYLDKLDFR